MRENFYVLPKRLKCIYGHGHTHRGSFHVNAKCLGGIERMEALRCFHPGELQKCRYSNCNLLCGKSSILDLVDQRELDTDCIFSGINNWTFLESGGSLTA